MISIHNRLCICLARTPQNCILVRIQAEEVQCKKAVLITRTILPSWLPAYCQKRKARVSTDRPFAQTRCYLVRLFLHYPPMQRKPGPQSHHILWGGDR